MQADVARLRVLVVGCGTVGLDVGPRLAATGIEYLGMMDFDTVEIPNLDRMIGATRLDALLHRSKVSVARRVLADAATAQNPQIHPYDLSVCEIDGQAVALDYDLIFSCVDRPWARAVLNQIAYTDLIPVIDGGISIDPFPDGGMRNATWRSHVIRSGRPCLACNRQLDLGEVGLDREGLLDDPTYIAGADTELGPRRQNVAALAVSVTATLLAQFVSLVVAPGGRGEPGPLQYVLSTHSLDRLGDESGANCIVEAEVARGDRRICLTGTHTLARRAQSERQAASRRLIVRVGRAADDGLHTLRRSLTSFVATFSQFRALGNREP